MHEDKGEGMRGHGGMTAVARVWAGIWDKDGGIGQGVWRGIQVTTWSDGATQ